MNEQTAPDSSPLVVVVEKKPLPKPRLVPSSEDPLEYIAAKPTPFPRKKMKPPPLPPARSDTTEPTSPSILGVPSPTPWGGLDNPEYVSHSEVQQMLANRKTLAKDETAWSPIKLSSPRPESTYLIDLHTPHDDESKQTAHPRLYPSLSREMVRCYSSEEKTPERNGTDVFGVDALLCGLEEKQHSPPHMNTEESRPLSPKHRSVTAIYPSMASTISLDDALLGGRGISQCLSPPPIAEDESEEEPGPTPPPRRYSPNRLRPAPPPPIGPPPDAPPPLPPRPEVSPVRPNENGVAPIRKIDRPIPVIPSGENICYNGSVRARLQTGKSPHGKRRHSPPPLSDWLGLLKDQQLHFYASTDTDYESPVVTIPSGQILYIAKDLSNDQFGVTIAYQNPTTGSTSSLLSKKKSQSSAVLPLSVVQLFCGSEVERNSWVMLLGKVIAPSPPHLADLIDENLDQAGLLYTKQNTGGTWHKSWAYRSGKTFTYRFLTAGDNFWLIDLRKVHHIRKDSGTSWCPDHRSSAAGPFLVSLDDFSLYAQAQYDVVSELWLENLTEELKKDSTKLSEQRLSKDDVPVLVLKCVKFLDTHGLTEKGLHRHSGTTSRVRELLEEFKKDPIEVHIRTEDYSVHDVASALRKFLRGLDEPLLPKFIRPDLVHICSFPESDYHHKLAAYRAALGKLPRINYATLKELLGHLKLLAELSHGNQMTVTNIAMIFGTTLFNVDNDVCEATQAGYGGTGEEISVMVDLISNYNPIFDLTAEEIGRRTLLSSRLQEGLKTKQNPQGGSLLVPIHVFELENEPFQKEISLTAGEVCEFTMRHKNLSEGRYSLFELVRGGALQRPIRSDERLLEIVVKRWHHAEALEISGSHLVFKRDLLSPRIEASDPYPFAEIKFADDGSKSFKKGSLALKSGDVCHYKDQKMQNLAHQWKDDDLLWFFGAEAKRDPPYKHALTFIPKESVPNPAKFYGMCICFKEERDLFRWLAAVLPLSRKKQNTH